VAGKVAEAQVAGRVAAKTLGRIVNWVLPALTATVLAAAGSAWGSSGSGASRSPETAPGAQAPHKAARQASGKPAPRAAPARKGPALSARPSAGQRAGLQATDDPLDLKSSVALVIDEETDQVLFSKNPQAVLPIASITKLMTALVIVESGLSLDEKLVISQKDVDAYRSGHSRLKAGTVLTRGEMLHLALMSSENRAAHALGRTFPAGMDGFVEAMNARARLLGMHHTRYVEPTGLSSQNQSSASDLALLVREASHHALIRDLSTTPDARVALGARSVEFHNTNGLVRNPGWDIVLQKTGYIAEAGRCVVMQAQLAGRKLIMVLLDSAGRNSRIGDAERLRAWVTKALPAPAESAAAPRY
jgi:D-alanyl-D-alanine endopeptidase (penicillin-binding protein 7)